jgi:sigma-B regulation protein RsbU (phosphoserine phosphatase)
MINLTESRVLIVDDTKSNIDALVQVLQGDYRLSVALSGEAALRAVDKSPPDLIMLDVVMPGIDGFEVCRLLREKPAYRDIPVMFLTGLQDVENKARGFEVGGNDYLTKPFEALEVRARVKAHLTAKAYSDAVKEKIASEMRIARDIQAGILECDIPRELSGTGLDVHARLEPAREVGGDLYVVLRDAEKVMVVVGDVSGKGVPAAIFMAVTTTLLRTVGKLMHRPEVILRHVNDELASQNPHGMFVTLACAVLEPARGKISYASAGHPSPVLLRPGQSPSYPFDATGMMAGIMVDNEITATEAALLPGDTYLFYSDGVTEAFNAPGEMFGEKRLLEAAGRGSALRAGELVAIVHQAVADFAGDHPQSDDITLLAVRFPGKAGL